jgi:hypothetical protein
MNWNSAWALSRMGKKRYQFISDYTTEITVGGVVGIWPRTFKKSEIFYGEPIGIGGNAGITHIKIDLNDSSGPWNALAGMIGAQTQVDIPYNLMKVYVQEDAKEKKERLKNYLIIASVLALLGIGGYLVIKES